MSKFAQNPNKLYIAGFVMENPDVWTDLKFYPTPGVGRSRKKPYFVHLSGTKLINMALKIALSLLKCLQTIFILNFNIKKLPRAGVGPPPQGLSTKVI